MLSNQSLLYRQTSSLLPSNRNRSLFVYSLVHAYGLLTTCTDPTTRRFVVVRPRPAGEKELLAYHTRDYLEYAMVQSNDAQNLLIASEFGLEDVRSIPNLSSGRVIPATGLPKISWDQRLHHTSRGSYLDRSSCHQKRCFRCSHLLGWGQVLAYFVVAFLAKLTQLLRVWQTSRRKSTGFGLLLRS